MNQHFSIIEQKKISNKAEIFQNTDKSKCKVQHHSKSFHFLEKKNLFF